MTSLWARLVCAASLQGGDALALATRFGESIWVHDEVLPSNCVSGVGLDFDALNALAASDEVTQKLKSFTDEAIAKQVFGMPTYMYDGEMFWGQDRIDFLQRAVIMKAKTVVTQVDVDQETDSGELRPPDLAAQRTEQPSRQLMGCRRSVTRLTYLLLVWHCRADCWHGTTCHRSMGRCRSGGGSVGVVSRPSRVRHFR